MDRMRATIAGVMTIGSLSDAACTKQPATAAATSSCADAVLACSTVS
jgi:hypothetical protein